MPRACDPVRMTPRTSASATARCMRSSRAVTGSVSPVRQLDFGARLGMPGSGRASHVHRRVPVASSFVDRLVRVTDQRRLAAVLFDMDGTLVDSEKIWQQALEELADRLGGDLAPAVRASMVGTTTPEAIAMLFKAIGPMT